MEGKVCSKCKEFKIYSDYFKSNKSKDKHKSSCKACDKIWSMQYLKNNKEKRKETTSKYYNKNKEKIAMQKKIYHKNNREKLKFKSREWQSKNKEYMKEWRKEYKEKNKEKIAQYKKEWASENKEKLRTADKKYYLSNRDKIYAKNIKRKSLKHNVIFEPFQRTELLNRDNYTCQLCSVKVHDRRTGDWNDEFKAHIDHIIPISRGGDSTPENLRVLCRTCNLSKSDKTDLEINKDGQITLSL